MTTPPFASPAAPSPIQAQELLAAQVAMKPIRRAIFMAQTDGWTLAVFAGLTLICGFSSVPSLFVGIGLGYVAYVEIRGIEKLRRLDPEVPQSLGQNQLILAAVLIVYALYNLSFPSMLSKEVIAQAGDLKAAGVDVVGLESLINRMVYGALIVVAITAQGSLALFYFRKSKTVVDYLSKTPAWILQMQRAGYRI